MKIIGIIPSRYSSTRFPGKPLADMKGKTMIRRVYEQASKSSVLAQVLVATDDNRIFDEVSRFGGKAIMTSSAHKNGTERCAEVALKMDADVFINIQGDEPLLHPENIDLLAACFIKEPQTQIATLVVEHALNEDLQNPARAKVVMNKQMEAMYFSRSTIPFLRDHKAFSVQGFKKEQIAAESSNFEKPQMLLMPFYKHIGIYGYGKGTLLEIVKLSASRLELAEQLEQLRWLENGYKIKCAVTSYDSLGIDTPEDLALCISKL